MPMITKTVSLDLEVTVEYDFNEVGNRYEINLLGLHSIKGMTPLLQLNGPRRPGISRDGTAGLVLDIDEFSSIPKLQLSAWINTSNALDEALLEQLEEAIVDQEHSGEDAAD